MVQADPLSLQPNAVLDAETDKLREACFEANSAFRVFDNKSVRIELRFTEIKTANMTLLFPANEEGVITYPATPCVL